MNKGNKHIYLLIGPKGSGKSFIGGLIHTYFNIPFIRVEDWVLEVRKERSLDDPAYIRDIFQTIEQKIREVLTELDQVVFESTGITDHFDEMHRNLQADFNVTTLRIHAEKEICIERIRSRDPSIHTNVSDVYLEEIHSAVLLKDFSADYDLENSAKSAEKLKEELRLILYNTTRAIP